MTAEADFDDNGAPSPKPPRQMCLCGRNFDDHSYEMTCGSRSHIVACPGMALVSGGVGENRSWVETRANRNAGT